jgi:hypothetical protein
MARSRSALNLLSGKIVDGIITMDASSRLPELATLIGSAPGCSARNMPMTAMSPAWASMMMAPRNV